MPFVNKITFPIIIMNIHIFKTICLFNIIYKHKIFSYIHSNNNSLYRKKIFNIFKWNKYCVIHEQVNKIINKIVINWNMVSILNTREIFNRDLANISQCLEILYWQSLLMTQLVFYGALIKSFLPEQNNILLWILSLIN